MIDTNDLKEHNNKLSRLRGFINKSIVDNASFSFQYRKKICLVSLLVSIAFIPFYLAYHEQLTSYPESFIRTNDFQLVVFLLTTLSGLLFFAPFFSFTYNIDLIKRKKIQDFIGATISISFMCSLAYAGVLYFLSYKIGYMLDASLEEIYYSIFDLLFYSVLLYPFINLLILFSYKNKDLTEKEYKEKKEITEDERLKLKEEYNKELEILKVFLSSNIKSISTFEILDEIIKKENFLHVEYALRHVKNDYAKKAGFDNFKEYRMNELILSENNHLINNL